MPEHILFLSHGKDSLACLGAIEQLRWPLDRIVHAEVWATDTIPADLPPMMEFILIPWNGETDSLPGFFLCGGRAGTAPGRYHVSSVGMTMLDTSCHTSGCAISIRVVALQAGYYVAQPPPYARWRMDATIAEWRGSETRVRLHMGA